MAKPNRFSKKSLSAGSGSLLETVKDEASRFGGEVIDQVTENPPLPSVSANQPSPLSSSVKQESEEKEEADANQKEARLIRIRKRLEQIKRETLGMRSSLDQERQEKAKKRDPVVEGIGVEKKENQEQKGDNLPLPLPETTSRPKRGLPPGIGQPEKRQRR